MLFRIAMTLTVLFAATLAGISAVQLLLDGRSVIAAAMAATSSGVALCAVGTWRWSTQAYPVKGIHYFD